MVIRMVEARRISSFFASFVAGERGGAEKEPRRGGVRTILYLRVVPHSLPFVEVKFQYLPTNQAALAEVQLRTGYHGLHHQGWREIYLLRRCPLGPLRNVVLHGVTGSADQNREHDGDRVPH